jgi:uncharacterized membrane protein YdjX (TVP38/TMEM64 family)
MKARRILSLAAFPAVFAAILAVGIVFRREIWGLFTSSQQLRDWIASAGVGAPLVFIGVQALQVVVFFIPGEIPQIAGGFLFGIWRGTLLSLAGITLGASFNFMMARLLGVPFVRALFPRKNVERVRRIADSGRARLTFFLFFLIPGIPKDVLCYAAGLSSLSLGAFLIFSGLGRLPGILGSALMGEAAASRRWLLAGGLLLLAVILFVAGFLLRDRIQGLLARLSRRRIDRRGKGAGRQAAPGDGRETPAGRRGAQVSRKGAPAGRPRAPASRREGPVSRREPSASRREAPRSPRGPPRSPEPPREGPAPSGSADT